ncbi:hypothetical protein DE146DRAFT_749967 [Phaeosphaeria sp. MPI-PUGE-AT-0046c]|nr:hypothetical protein DE146DRAFT_749967 [Phaeosphaeria sp. MPI-PUGE-AT-0046c]
MSSITAPSFIDDGTSFHNRLPPSDITKWLNGTSSSTSSAYTGSFIDDGADMLLPSQHRPGFGAVNTRFYRQRKRRDDEKRGAWNGDIQRAVAGDIGRSLEGLKGVGGVEFRRGDREGKEVRKGRKKTTVTVPLPRRWGTIVIKDEGGRVIVVDELGEFDSGARQEGEEQSGGKWAQAVTTISETSLEMAPEWERVRQEKRRGKQKKHFAEPMGVLTPILESEYEEVTIEDAAETGVMSPTELFMTGGASGWPSPKRSSVAYSSVNSLSKPKKGSPVQSLPGSWPSPPQSPTENVVTSETYSDSKSSKQSWGKVPSHQSYDNRKSNGSSIHSDDHVSVKTYSTYKPVTIEDVPDTSSDHASVLADAGWQDEHQPPTWQDWAGSRIETVSEASSRASCPQGERSYTPSEVRWDGYERPKTESEVSVVGSGSERSWPGSRVSSMHSRRSNVSRQQSRGGSYHGGQAGWGGSEGWGGSQGANVDGWGGQGSGHGSGTERWGIYETSEDEDGAV